VGVIKPHLSFSPLPFIPSRKGRGDELTDRLDGRILNKSVFCGCEMFFPKTGKGEGIYKGMMP
jgi:hypothetical protein